MSFTSRHYFVYCSWSGSGKADLESWAGGQRVLLVMSKSETEWKHLECKELKKIITWINWSGKHMKTRKWTEEQLWSNIWIWKHFKLGASTHCGQLSQVIQRHRQGSISYLMGNSSPRPCLVCKCRSSRGLDCYLHPQSWDERTKIKTLMLHSVS